MLGARDTTRRFCSSSPRRALRGRRARKAVEAAPEKNWYTASASTGALNFEWRMDSMPPTTGWAVSTEFAKYVAADLTSSIEPPPTIVVLSESEPIPNDVARDMLRRGMKYTAERE
jgi:hypothetical protein